MFVQFTFVGLIDVFCFPLL